MKATTVVLLVGVALVVFALLPYLLAIGLAGGIVHTAGKWRREARSRRERMWAAEAVRELAHRPPRGPLPHVRYGGILNPSSPAWYDRGDE